MRRMVSLRSWGKQPLKTPTLIMGSSCGLSAKRPSIGLARSLGRYPITSARVTARPSAAER
jgi:hypothetical protein